MRKNKVVICDHFNDEIKCNGRFCEKCISKHYQQNIEDIENKQVWDCFKCLKVCSCAACIREKNKKPSKRNKKPKQRGRPRKIKSPQSEETNSNTKRATPPINKNVQNKKLKVETNPFFALDCLISATQSEINKIRKESRSESEESVPKYNEKKIFVNIITSN